MLQLITTAKHGRLFRCCHHRVSVQSQMLRGMKRQQLTAIMHGHTKDDDKATPRVSQHGLRQWRQLSFDEQKDQLTSLNNGYVYVFGEPCPADFEILAYPEEDVQEARDHSLWPPQNHEKADQLQAHLACLSLVS